MAKKIVHGPNFVDLTGKQYGRLTVISYAGRYEKDYHSKWRCRCICGRRVIVAVNHLRGGRIQSCGCLQKELTGNRFRSHGKRRAAEYRIWCAMRERCFCERGPFYHRYGGRGISVSERWLGPNGFTNFLTDMGRRPSRKYTLERINNDGNYEPSNCRWATRKEQCRNTSRNHRYTFQGKTLTLPEWAECLGMNENTLNSRLRIYGWTIERALTTPVKR